MKLLMDDVNQQGVIMDQIKSKFFHKSWFYLILSLVSTPILCDQIFTNDNHETIRIEVVKSAKDIDLKQSCDILVKSFMDAYEDVPLAELSAKFKSTGDVRRFYQDYFKEELEHFKHGNLYWVQAFVNENLAGWATFELEANEADAAYMNLLIVSPEYQRKNVGTHLVFAIRSEELFPNVKAINLLIRKVNTQGYLFYRKLGFFESDYQRDNFVDPSLLTGLRWVKSD